MCTTPIDRVTKTQAERHTKRSRDRSFLPSLSFSSPPLFPSFLPSSLSLPPIFSPSLSPLSLLLFHRPFSPPSSLLYPPSFSPLSPSLFSFSPSPLLFLLPLPLSKHPKGNTSPFRVRGMQNEERKHWFLFGYYKTTIIS